MLLGVLVLCQCGQDDPEPDTTTTTTNADGTVTYYVDGVLHTSNIGSDGAIIYNGLFQLLASDMSDPQVYYGITLNYMGIDSIGTYYLEDSLSFVTDYIALSVGTNGYFTGYCQYSGNNGAYINITKLDYTNSIISGTFEGQVCYELDTIGGATILDTVTHIITDGIFTNVPVTIID